MNFFSHMQIQAHLQKKWKQTPSLQVFNQQGSCIRWARPPSNQIELFTTCIPKITQIFFFFFRQGFMHCFKLHSSLDYSVFQNIYQVNSNSIQKIIEIFIGQSRRPFFCIHLFPSCKFLLQVMCPIENGDFCLIHHLSYPEADSIKKKLSILNRSL